MVFVGIGGGVVVAYLLTAGQWHFALALIAMVPGFVILHKYPFQTIVIWLFLGPFLLHTTSNAERQVYWIIHRGLPPLTVGVIWMSSLLRIRKRRLPRLGIPEMLMAGYVIFTILSIIFQSTTPQATFYHFYDRVISPMCLYLIIRLTTPGDQEWNWLVPIFVFIIITQSMIGTVSWVAPSLLPSKWLDKVGQRTTGTLVNPTIFTTAILFAGILGLHSILQYKRQRILSNTNIVLFLLCVFSIFISFSRGSWLAGIMVLGGVVYLYPKFMLKFSIVLVLVSTVAGGAFLPPYIEQARHRLYSDQSEGSALDRLPGFLAAVRMFEAKPIAGWGYGNFDVYDKQFMGRVLDFANDNKDHASHNWFLSTLAEQGLVGFFLYFSPFAWWALISIRNWHQLPKRGVWNRKLLLLLWLLVLSDVLLNNFMNMIIFFGHGIWWIRLGMIANLLAGKRLKQQPDTLAKKATAVWKTAPVTPFGS